VRQPATYSVESDRSQLYWHGSGQTYPWRVNTIFLKRRKTSSPLRRTPAGGARQQRGMWTYHDGAVRQQLRYDPHRALLTARTPRDILLRYPLHERFCGFER